MTDKAGYARTEYAQLRRKGYRAAEALRNARIQTAFDACEDVRLVWRPDENCYDDSYIDTWTDQTPTQREKARKDLWALIEREGVWGCIAQRRCPCCGSWRGIDGVWGLVGQDAAGYEFDLMSAALDAGKGA